MANCETCKANKVCDHNKYGFENCNNYISADVLKVVRCKDCKRCYEKRTKRNNQLVRFCMRMDGNEYQVNANDFCSYGTSKERGGEK